MNRRQFLISVTYTAAGICLSPSILVRDARSRDLAGLPYFDFAERFDDLYLIEQTDQIDFSAPADSQFLIDGWSVPEPHHTWAVNNTASVRFYSFDADNTDKSLQIICSAYHHLKKQKIQIYLNGHLTTALRVSGKEEKFTVQMPADALVDGENILTFIFSECGKPLDYGDNKDDRCLSVCFRKILFAGANAGKRRNRIQSNKDGCISMPLNSGVRHFLYIEPDSRLILEASANMKSASDAFSVSVATQNDEIPLCKISSGDLPLRDNIDLKRFSSGFATLTTRFSGPDRSSGELPVVKWKGAIQTTRKSLPDRPNLLFIVIDTLRADHCGCLGASIETPNIDRLARSGTLFQQAFTHIPITLPAHATMFSSLYPHETHILNNGQQLSDQFRLLGAYFKGMRFFNTGIISLGTLDPETNIGLGFNQFRGTNPFSIRQANEINTHLPNLTRELAKQDNWATFLHYSDPHDPYHGHKPQQRMVEVRLNDDSFSRLDIGVKSTFTLSGTLKSGENILSFKAPCRFHLRQLDIAPSIRWDVVSGSTSGAYILNKTRDGRILLHNDTGAPKTFQFNIFITEFLEAEGIRTQYKREVQHADRYLGKALAHFHDSGLLKNTVVIFTSDHGEGLGEHGENGHINQLYNSMTHVPLIVSHPAIIKGGQKVSARVRLIDILPTLFDVSGVAAPPRLRGQSLMPMIQKKEKNDRPLLAMTFKNEAPHNLVSLAEGNYKIIKNMNTGELELYDLQSDPKELGNLIDTNFLMANRMEKALYHQLTACGYPLETADQVQATPHTDPATIEMLRGLGYVK